MKAPILETERLVLRAAEPCDIDAAATMWGSQDVTRFIGGKPRTRQDAWFALLRGVGRIDGDRMIEIKPAGGSKSFPPIREAIRLFETHVEDPLRIPDVAAAVSMSGRHFERLFKRETGQSPLRYYRHLRLAKARQRVLYSNDPLREIAAAVGYLTPAPMARHYQELFGVSPKDERRLASGLSRAVPVAAE